MYLGYLALPEVRADHLTQGFLLVQLLLLVPVHLMDPGDPDHQ